MTDQVSGQVVQSVRRRRAWWQWTLGGGLLLTAVILGGIRMAMVTWPHLFLLNMMADPIPLKLPDGMKQVDRVPASPGALADHNVLLITLDTTRADRLGCYGNPDIKTPVLDDLARKGVLFTKAIAPTPTTLPSHASILTGLYPHHHGALANAIFRLEDNFTTLPEIFSAKGYATGAAVSAYVLDSRFGLAQGFNVYDDALKREEKTRPLVEPERVGDVTTEIALEWLDRHRKGRFFYWIHYFDPHQPYEPPGRFAEDYESFPYDGEIAFTDTQIARLIDFLDESGIRDKTLVVVIGDHGQGMGQHQELTHGFMLYDATLHVPFIMNCPSKLPGGVYFDREVSSVDVAPTILSLLGLAPLDPCDGLDLTRPPPDDRLIYMYTAEALHQYGFAPLLGVRDGKKKYIFGPQPELYDTVSDPYETKDLIAQAKDVAEDLRKKLELEHGGDLMAAAYVQPSEQLSDDDVKMLEALGYVRSGIGSAPPKGDLPNPRDMMSLVYETEAAYSHDSKEGAAEAAQRLRKVLEKSPDFYIAQRWLADCYMEIGDDENARIALERCDELQPGVSFHVSKLARIYFRLGRVEDSIKRYEELILNCPDHFPALSELGAIYLHYNQPQKAANLLLQACTLRPTDEIVVDRMADAMKRVGRIDEAIAFLKYRLEKHPRAAAVRNALAGLVLEKGNCKLCIKLMREGVALNPESDPMINNLCWALVRCYPPYAPEITEAALKMEEVCNRTGYKDPYFLRTLAAVYFARRRTDEALATAKKAHGLAAEIGDKALAASIDTDLGMYERARTMGISPTTLGIPGAQTTSEPADDSEDEVDAAPKPSEKSGF